jgi:hypothetical protein
MVAVNLKKPALDRGGSGHFISCAWVRSSPSRQHTTATATASLNTSSIVPRAASAKTTTPFWRLATWQPCRPPPTSSAPKSSWARRLHLRPWPEVLRQGRKQVKLSRAYAILERDGTRYAYLLTPRGFRSHCSSCSSVSACRTTRQQSLPPSAKPPPSATRRSRGRLPPRRQRRRTGPSLRHEKSKDSDLFKSPVDLNLGITPNSVVGLTFSSSQVLKLWKNRNPKRHGSSHPAFFRLTRS